MSLLKCPECGNMVSEHANSCPSCGCTISYIKKYYLNQEKPVKKPKEIINEGIEQLTISFYSLLDQKVKTFFKKISNYLKEKNIKYSFINTETICGFKENDKEKMFCYLCEKKEGNIYICIKNEKDETDVFELFDLEKEDKYLKIIHSYFGKSENKNDAINVKGTSKYIFQNGGNNIIEKPHIIPEKEKYKFDLDLKDETVFDVHTFVEYMKENDFRFVDDKKCIKFYSNKDADVSRSWFYIIKGTAKDAFTKQIIPSFSVHYYLDPTNPKKTLKEIFYGRKDLSNKLIGLVSRVKYHREIKKWLMPFSIYWNIIKATCGYGSDFPEQFSYLLNVVDIRKNEPISTYDDAIEAYKKWKSDIVYEYLMKKLNKAKVYGSIVVDEKEFKNSIRKLCISKNYSLSRLQGVRQDIQNFVGNDFDLITECFDRFDCEMISEKILEIEI